MPSMLERYQQAAALAPERLPGLMRNRRIVPTWTGDGDAFWYARQTDAGGEEFVLIDPDAGTRTAAATLAELGVTDAATPPPPGVLVGPDGRGLRRRDHNLWLIDGESETPVTSDGEADFAWGAISADNNMVIPFRRMGLDLPPVATVHSPSGRRVFTMRVDERQMANRVLVEHVPASGARPVAHEWKVQLEDEGAPPAAECRILALDTGDSVDVDVRDGLGSLVMLNGKSEVTWSPDETRLYLFDHRHGGARAVLVEIDTTTGARRDAVVLDDAPLYEANQFLYNLPLVWVLPETGEAVLFSQHDGWGHLTLYDLVTGERKNAISAGEIVVRDLLHVDAERREITYLAGTGVDGGNPYWRRVYRAGLDGATQRLLTPELCDHDLVAPEPQFFHLVFGQGKPPARSISPSGRYVVDHQSTVSDAPVIVLRDADAGGEIIRELERTDIRPLLEAGYVVPQAFCVKADDGVTDLWGVISLPADPIDAQRIPVVEDIYGGFQTTHAPHAFIGASKLAARQVYLPAYNALGFAAVMVDGRGTPGRDRTFRQWTFQHFHTTRGLEDHVTAISALAATHPQLDLDHVGVVGHSYGGYNAARMLMLFPEFYRAGVSSAGVHDPRKMRHGQWDWHLGVEPDRESEEYRGLGNVALADRLVGDLLIACGELDENAPIDHSYALADALIRAGKRFDFKVWPGVNHYVISPYALMTFWDHLVRSLHGAQPPREFVPG